MSEENAGISICRRNFSQGKYSNIIFPLIKNPAANKNASAITDESATYSGQEECI